MTGELRRMISGELPRIKCTYDVLMDGYTWYAGVQYLHTAEALGWDLLEANPKAIIQVRKIETFTTHFELFMGIPTDGQGVPI